MSCSNNTTVIRKDPNALNCGPSCGSGGLSFDSKCNPLHRKKREAVVDQIKEYCLLMLGAPVIDIELDDQQIEAAIRQVLRVIEQYAPKEYFSYYTFITTPGKSVYEMPAEVGYIRQVSYKQQGELSFQSSDLQGVIPLEYFMPGGIGSSSGGGSYGNGFIDPSQPIWGNMGGWTVFKSYERLYSSLSSNLGSWEWIGGYRHIKLYPIPFKPYRVVVHYMQKCKDWEEMTDCMASGCLASLKMVLGLIRRKYTNIPGPNGGIQLDGQQMYQDGKEQYDAWKEELIYKYGEIFGPTYG